MLLLWGWWDSHRWRTTVPFHQTGIVLVHMKGSLCVDLDVLHDFGHKARRTQLGTDQARGNGWWLFRDFREDSDILQNSMIRIRYTVLVPLYLVTWGILLTRRRCHLARWWQSTLPAEKKLPRSGWLR